MGSQRDSGVALTLLGSTTQTVVRRAACPVLTTRGRRTCEQRKGALPRALKVSGQVALRGT
jgi:hypothetical protein